MPFGNVISTPGAPVQAVKGKRFTLGQVFICLLVVAAMVRLVDLGSFPEVQADEGLWTTSTKNYLLFGDWFMDGRTHMLLSPVFHLASLATFAVFGVSIVSARLVSVLAGTISIVLLFLLIRRTARAEWTAVVATALLACDQWSVLINRSALIESLQLMFLLAALVVLSGAKKRRWVWGGLLFGMALLTKINALFMAPVLAVVSLMNEQGPKSGPGVARAAAVIAVGVIVAAVGYGLLYLKYPAEFVAAFKFELDGRHFESLSHPVVRVGRFGLDPTQAGRSLLELFRESPFLLVLATIGATLSMFRKPLGWVVFGLWFLLGSGFVLTQMFQPVRYFYLASPAFAFFATQPLAVLREMPGREIRNATTTIVCVISLFGILYTGMNWGANRGVRLRAVTRWSETHLTGRDRVMAAAYLCTDLPGRAYAHYNFVRTPEQLLSAIDQLHITYVIADDREWRPQLKAELRKRYPEVQRWKFASVYRVR